MFNNKFDKTHSVIADSTSKMPDEEPFIVTDITMRLELGLAWHLLKLYSLKQNLSYDGINEQNNKIYHCCLTT